MPIYNPKNIVCIVCKRTDCEHFDLPEVKPGYSPGLARRMIAAGWQPFIYQPYIPFCAMPSVMGKEEKETPDE